MELPASNNNQLAWEIRNLLKIFSNFNVLKCLKFELLTVYYLLIEIYNWILFPKIKTVIFSTERHFIVLPWLHTTIID